MSSPHPGPDSGDLGARARAGDPVALTRAMVRVPSVNPELEEGGAGEGELARICAGWLEAWGFRVERSEVASGRWNVVAEHGGEGRTLLLNGHLDTVGVEGMTIPPFGGALRDGRIWGRGSCDMKAGNASLLAAARRLAAEGHEGRVVVALTADEEHASVGMDALVAEGIRAHGGIVCEPTGLAVMPAHRGFLWVTLRFRGRAAHGSRPDLGVDAIRHAGRVLSALDGYEARLAERDPHPLLIGPSVHAGTIRGGVAPSVYPERCELVLERRTLPGESRDEVLAELREVVEGVREEVADLDVGIEPGLARPGTEVPPSSPVVAGLVEAGREEGREVPIEGMTAWVDAALLNEAGIPAVCFGPGSISEAHSARESVPADEVESCARILERFARSFLSAGTTRR